MNDPTGQSAGQPASVGGSVPEQPDIRLKRLRMRSWRRGTREMDLILGPYADAALTTLDRRGLDEYEALLEQPDPDLYAWICGGGEPDAGCRPAVDRVRRYHQIG